MIVSDVLTTGREQGFEGGVDAVLAELVELVRSGLGEHAAP